MLVDQLIRARGFAMTRADELRQNADNCFAKARRAVNPSARGAMLDMALYWLEQAHLAEMSATNCQSAEGANTGSASQEG